MESATQRIEITDASTQAVEALLCFVYTGETQVQEGSILEEVAILADKYEVHSFVTTMTDDSDFEELFTTKRTCQLITTYYQ